MAYLGTFQIGFIGLGAMGSRMVAALMRAGHVVTVFNRSADRVQPLVGLGAHAASSPRDAAAGADFVISMVRDDEASLAVWTDPVFGALAGMQPGAVAIESSTLSPAWIKQLATAALAAGVEFLEAPVAGSRPQADAAQLIYFVGGELGTVQRTDLLLRAMGAAVHHTGPVGSAAVIKLMVNTLLVTQVAVLAEVLSMARRSGLNMAWAADVLAATPVASPAAKAAASAICAGSFSPMFPVELAEKDLRYVLAAALAQGQDMPVAGCVHQQLQRAMDQGWAGHHITALARLHGAA
jgi:3-hydroxyisobutyrate dehydrogenase